MRPQETPPAPRLAYTKLAGVVVPVTILGYADTAQENGYYVCEAREGIVAIPYSRVYPTAHAAATWCPQCPQAHNARQI